MPDEINETLARILHEVVDGRRVLEGRIGGLEGRFDTLEGRFDGLEGRMVGIEGRLDARIGDIEGRLDALEKKLDSFRDETLVHFDAIYGRLERLETEYQAISAALKRVEKMLSEQASDRQVLEAEIESLKARLADLEKRLAELEEEVNDSHDA